MSDQGHADHQAGSSSSAQPDMADISRILSVSDVVLEPRDYMVWRIRMESRLQSAELFDHVSGPVPPQPSQDWLKRDFKVRDFLIRHLPNHLILEISSCASAASLWQLLNVMYGQQEATDRCKLKHEWHSLRLKFRRIIVEIQKSSQRSGSEKRDRWHPTSRG